MKTMKYILSILALLFVSIVPAIAQGTASAAPVISAGNTAWIIMASGLVLLMTIPGLALFYGGLVRQKNVLNIFMKCFFAMAIITLQWVIFGYSITFGSSTGFLKPFIGGFDWAFLRNIKITDVSPYFVSQPHERIPHILFIIYQCMFAVITPALIIGAFAERIKFSGYVLFIVLWATFVYDPVAHWIWSSDGWLYKLGALDFAGGTVVHINAGIASLVVALMIGKRRHYRNSPLPPHNIPFVAIGTGLLWFGWIGFNAGSGLAADGLAASAFLVTHVAAATAALTWAVLDWVLNKKPTVVGIATGAVAGLATITQAAGFVGIGGAIVIGIAASVVCFYMVGFVKVRFGYDDTLDAFGVHGVGGIIGCLLTGVFASPAIQNYSGLLYGNFHQMWIQFLMFLVVTIYSLVVTYILFKIVDKLVGVRVTDKEEAMGLDFALHHETAYTSID